MENAKLICKTDAEILLEFEHLKDSGFAFVYVKREGGVLQYYVNCNGKVYGPFEDVGLNYISNGIAEWTGWKGDIEFRYENNGKDCETKNRKSGEGNSIITQEEIDQLLSAAAGNSEKEYNEQTHILRKNQNQYFFLVSEKKKYGPYPSIFHTEYKSENCFQFIYKKRQKTDRWYYNFNGKEIGPFLGFCPICYYDSQNRAIVDELGHYNFILVDGEKIKCFNKKYTYCKIVEKNGHQIIIGQESNGLTHFKRDGILQDCAVNSIHKLDNGDVAYSKIQDDTETWFYNDKQISVPIKGYASGIYDSIITYRRKDCKDLSFIPYFMKNGKEYNGFPIEGLKGGFVFLDGGKVQFLSWCVPKPWDLDSPNPFEAYNIYQDGMFMRLYYTNQLAGRD